MKRCDWVNDDPLYIHYHDEVWGKEVHDDQTLFKMLCLEGQQAGLSWYTILKRQEEYEKAFYDFDVTKVAMMKSEDITTIMHTYNIIKHRKKLESIVQNAKAFQKIQAEYQSFDQYIWSYVGYHQQVNHFKTGNQVPSYTPTSTKISIDLKKRGFTFVGPTIIYAYMQAIGMVNDHLLDCFCRKGQ